MAPVDTADTITLDSKSAWDACFAGIKREFVEAVDSECDEGVELEPHPKRLTLERRKSVRFADELNIKLESIYPIPVKEETWPYGSLSGELFPKAFPEFMHLYNNDPAFEEPALPAPAPQDDLRCFDDIRTCVGMSFLTMDGSIVRGVCATAETLYCKKYMRFEHLVEKGWLNNKDLEGIRPADYIETDLYVPVHRSQVASKCRILCINADMSKDASAYGSNSSLNSDSDEKKTFYYSWFCSTATGNIFAYVADDKQRVSVFWPADRKWYAGHIQGVNKGYHQVVYDCDNSVEDVNLLQMREQGCVRFL